eukprot:COSAG04_NODE_175_length_21521_cov_167.404071_24_plen_213_part_00
MRPAPPLLLAGLATTALRGAGSVGVMGADEGAGAPSPDSMTGEAAATPGGGGSLQRHDRCVIGAGPAGLCAPHTPAILRSAVSPGAFSPRTAAPARRRRPRAAAPPAKTAAAPSGTAADAKAPFGLAQAARVLLRAVGAGLHHPRAGGGSRQLLPQVPAPPPAHLHQQAQHRPRCAASQPVQSARDGGENRCAFLLPAFSVGGFAFAGGRRP